MRIYQMTATFGKLEHQTLTLKPGLNVITAPNEWGKSTWCAFLVAMLYGLDTRVKSTKTTLADKERYLPWSGAPMAGRIDLNWNGRDITIERKTKRRVPLGEFRAYETKSGLPVPELTAANCGQTLLGVERTVFCRAGFIRHADLPVTQDEALRRRLNALVTTGDESGAADRLEATLKDLRNRCRYNRTGLLPQAETERDALEARLAELEALDSQCAKLNDRIDELKEWLSQLANHQHALEYAAAQAAAQRAAQAGEAMEDAQKQLRKLEEICAELPSREEAEQKTRELRALREQWNAIQAESRELPREPEVPQVPEPFTGMPPEEARKMARQDGEAYVAACRTGMPKTLIGVSILGFAGTGLLIWLKAYLFAAIAGAASVLAMGWGIFELVSLKKKAKALEEKYGDDDYPRWAIPIMGYEQAIRRYHAELRAFKEASGDVEVRMMVLRKKRESLCGDRELEEVQEYWTRVVSSWDACQAVRRETEQARRHYETLNALVRPVDAPKMEDQLTHTEAETARLLADCTQEQQRLQNRLGQYQGRMEALGDAKALLRQLEQKNKRIAALEETYGALVIAQETLAKAKEELQRRFAPRITKRAQKLLGTMTGGRYDTMTMGVDFSLRAKTEQEDTLHDAIWRSDGTMDQLYLALRLAVAEELTPGTPLVLDDALVRFDDQRMKAAVGILEEMSRDRQVILFTCQGREAEV